MNTRSLSLLFVGVMACSSGSSSAPGSGGTSSATGGKGTGGSGPSSGGTTGSGGAPGTGGTGTGGSPGTGGGGDATGGSRSGGSGVAGSGMGGRNAVGGGTVATGGSAGGGAPPSGFAVVTDRYDNARSGANTSETILTPSNVTAARFGLLFSRTIVGDAYGQPLYVGGLTVNGAKHNVVYIATQRNMVYAFDADAATPDVPLWSKSMGVSMSLGSPPADFDPTCLDMRREVGITSTPVISLTQGKIFVVAKTANDQQLHALDLATGAEGVGSPVSVGKTAMPAFDPQLQLNRPGLLLLNGIIYIAYGSHCDKTTTYHGWIFGHDATTLALKSAYNTTPNGQRGAIWQSGVGLSSDGTDIWATIGNAENPGNGGFGNNVVRLTPTGGGMTVTSHFQAPVSGGDNDLQSGAPLLGTTGQVVAGGKDGEILLLGQADLVARQRMPIGGELNSFAFWPGSAGPTLFTWQVGKPLQAYRVGAGSLTRGATGSVSTSLHPSAIFTVSSNGNISGTGIVWGSVPVSGDAWHATATGTLHAIDATTLTPIWNSGNGADALGTYAKYSPPIVANGKVYVATFSGKLQVYGLK